jgi:hypothetical protein
VRFYAPEPLDRELQRREDLVYIVFVDVVIDVFNNVVDVGMFDAVFFCLSGHT